MDDLLVGGCEEKALVLLEKIEGSEDAEVLIKMANDETGEYEVYGIMSAEYGAFGFLFPYHRAGDHRLLCYGLGF